MVIQRRSFVEMAATIGVASFVPFDVAAQTKKSADVALVLSTDVSSSIDHREYQLQKQGIASAFLSSQMKSILKSVSVAVIYQEWSSSHKFGSWMLIENELDARKFAASVLEFRRHDEGGSMTAVASAIAAAVDVFATCPYSVDKKVIDVSGDGKDNVDGNMVFAKAKALANGVQVNGLPILDTEEANLESWYRENVLVGQNAFLEVAQDFQDFERAIKRKLILEIG